MKSTLAPLDDKVVLLPDPLPKSTAGGLLLPDTLADCKPRFATVLAVGPGRWLVDERTGELVRVPMALKVGDRVAFSHYGTDGIELDGEEILVIPESRVLGVVCDHAVESSH